MDLDRWRQIEEIYQSAAERKTEERASYLAVACAGDKELRREVESLLSQNSQDTPLDRPVWNLAAGGRVGPYELLEPIGSGGMGMVFKARDTRLGREVAIKFSKREFDERFRREAHAVAALNHPHVCTLYDVGPDYLVMEFVDGRPLKGPLAPEEAIPIAIQIAEALDAAHRAGIVHRDLKPDNILLTKSGVKLLDFGLAKQRPAAVDGASDQTATKPLTGEGAILGTPHYMSPEQVEGRQTDARSDIFAFGCVLYEMLTGRRAFDGISTASVIAAILAAEPKPVHELQPLARPALERVVKICLAKDPDERWQSARDLKHALAGIPEPVSAPARVAALRAHAGWIAAGVLLLVLGYLIMSRSPQIGAQVRFSIPTLSNAAPGVPLVSPDGKRVAFMRPAGGDRLLHIRALDSVQLQPVPGTEGLTFAAWSPDSRSIVFTAGARLMRVDLPGGRPRTLCTAKGLFYGVAWSREGVILCGVAGQGLMRAPAGGGELTAVTQMDATKSESAHAFPRFLPDQRRFLYFAAIGSDLRLKWGSLDGTQSGELPVTAGPAAYVERGYLIYPREEGLFAQRLDLRSMLLTGEPSMIAEPVAQQPWVGHDISLMVVQFFPFDVSENGVLVWLAGTDRNLSELAWFDVTGRRLGTLGPKADYTNPALSPDGGRVAVCISDPATGKRDIWIVDLARGSRTRLTSDPGDDLNPVWSPDGGMIAFTSDRRGERDLYVKSASGIGEDQLLLASETRKSTENWSDVGNFLLYNEHKPPGPVSIFALPMTRGAERKPLAVVQGPFNQSMSQLSPDGKTLAYCSNESGRTEVYVQRFPVSGGRWQVSADGGVEPQWRRDGKELYYLSGQNLMAVPVKTDGTGFEAGIPRVLFGARLPPGVRRNRYLVAPDGRFLVITAPEPADPPSLTVLLNWKTGLQR